MNYQLFFIMCLVFSVLAKAYGQGGPRNLRLKRFEETLHDSKTILLKMFNFSSNLEVLQTLACSL